MIGQIILWAIIIIGFGLLFKVVYDSDKRYKWFMSLKPGDKIRVWVFSQYCECTREAEVTKVPDGREIEAKILEDCKECSLANRRNKNGEETCWYNVTRFKKTDVGKI